MQVNTESFRQQRFKYSKHASSLTLRQRCQHVAAFEVERLERCAVAETCMSQTQNQAHRSIRYADAGRVTLTFWEGLEVFAEVEVELLQVAELSCGFKTIA